MPRARAREQGGVELWAGGKRGSRRLRGPRSRPMLRALLRPRPTTAPLSAAMSSGGRALLEVERKFLLPPADGGAFAASLAPLALSVRRAFPISDVYFDAPAPDFTLTRKDAWLRRRDAAWELKWPLHADGGPSSSSSSDDAYVEHVDPPDIARRLGLPEEDVRALEEAAATMPAAAVADALESTVRRCLGVVPFADIETIRTSHTLPVAPEAEAAAREAGVRIVSVGIDLDVVRYRAQGDAYALGEVEVMVDRGGEEGAGSAAAATAAVDAVCAAYGVPARAAGPVRGKVIEYLYRHDRTHYAVAVAAKPGRG